MKIAKPIAVSEAPIFVVPVDFAPEMEATVSAAFALAKRCGAHVHLIEVVSSRGPSLPDGGTRASLGSPVASKADWSRLEEAIRAAERGQTPVRTVAYRGDKIEVIASYVELTSARLIIVGRHYGTSQSRRNVRLVTHLSRNARAPVLILPPRPLFEKGRERSFSHLVSAVDFTTASAVAVRTVLDLIRRSGARLTLVHALESAPDRTVYSGFEALRISRNLEAQAAHVASRLRSKVPADIRLRVDARVTTGDAHRAILSVASEVEADLLVMGVPLRSRLDQVLLGSTLRGVLRGAQIPVLVLPVPAGAYRSLQGADGSRSR